MNNPTSLFFVSLDVPAGQTLGPTTNTNSNSDQRSVFFLVIALFIKDTNV